jgi:hypothetical protein
MKPREREAGHEATESEPPESASSTPVQAV